MNMNLNKKILLIIPTYNENENIEKVISIVRRLREKIENHLYLEVLVIDDSSTDGTGLTVKKMQSDDQASLCSSN